MALEYKLPYTASEINRKLVMVDETKNSLENDYYTSTEIDTKLDEVNTSFEEINSFAEETISSIDGINASLETKADLVDGKIPVEQLPDDIGGGASSWNDLEDKPFYETGLKYEWDGETSDKEHLAIVDGFDFYRISSDILTADELIGITAKIYFDGEFIENEISQDGDIVPVQTDSGNLVVMCNGQTPVCLIASQAGEDNFMGITFSIPSTGVWFFHGSEEGEYTYYLQKGVGIKTLDKKFIPSDIGTWEAMPDKPFYETGWSIEWDANLTSATESIFVAELNATFCKVSDSIISYNEILGCTVDMFIDGESSYTINEDLIVGFDAGNEDSFMIFNNMPFLFSIVEAESISAFGITIPFPSSGLWFLWVDDAYYTSSLSKIEIKKIDKKYLPDDIGGSISLDNYYTKSETDDLIENVSVDLSNYYTKSEIDDMIGDCDSIINSINTLVGGGNV